MRARCPGTASRGAEETAISPARAGAHLHRRQRTVIELYSIIVFAKDDGKQATITPLSSATSAHRVADVQKVVKFYTEVLGFRVSDWRDDTFAFVRCGVDHHTVNFRGRSKAQLHHIPCEVKDWPEIHRACDFLGKNKIQLVWARPPHHRPHVAAITATPTHPRRAVLRDGPDQGRGAGLFRPAAVASGPAAGCRRPGRRTRSATTGRFGSQGTFQAIRENRRPTPRLTMVNES